MLAEPFIIWLTILFGCGRTINFTMTRLPRANFFDYFFIFFFFFSFFSFFLRECARGIPLINVNWEWENGMELELKVKEAFQSDVGRGIVRLDLKAMNSLG